MKLKLVVLGFVAGMLAASCTQLQSGIYKEQRGKILVLEDELSCTTSAFDNSRCVIRYYCVSPVPQGAKLGDPIKLPSNECYNYPQDVPQ